MSRLKSSTKSDKIFNFVNYTLLALLMISILYPFWNLLITSLNDASAGSISGLALKPNKFTLNNYRHVLSSKYIWIGYRETLLRTIVGTTVSVICTTMGAYALAKKRLPNRNFWTIFIVIPMFFSGGLIPSYLWNVELGLINNRLIFILPGLVGSYNLLIMRNFFMSIPAELEESAKIDGANTFEILFKIVIPLSKAVIATISLWCMVGHWNAWFDAVIYMDDPNKLPLQAVLRRILMEGTNQLLQMNNQEMSSSVVVTPETLKAASVFICIIPIMCIYPFLQKYFAKGIMVGSVKG